LIQINLKEWEDIGALEEFKEQPFIPVFEINKESKEYIEIKDTSKGGVRIKAKNFVGFIPLEDNYLLIVSPKVPVEDFLYILFRAQGKRIQPKDFERIVKTGRERGLEHLNTFHFLLYVLLQELEKIRTVGFLKRSNLRIENRKSIKGKILIKDTILKNHVVGRKDEIMCSYYDLSKNIPENVAIKFTLWLLLNLPEMPRSAIGEFFERYRYFYDISLPVDIDFLDKVEEIVGRNKIPISRQYYTDILNLCVFFITHSKLEYKAGKEVKLRAFVIDMNTVFEEYIRVVLKDGISDNITIKKTSKLLFDNRTSSEFRIDPDYVFVVNDSSICIADAKYKEKPSIDDFYQILAYLDVFNLKTGILIYPLFENESEIEKFSRGEKEIWIYRMNLEKLKDSEERLISFIEGRVNERTLL
jgi:5-methylcytosine-specific restriction endonuclease McrBC regulatory subunit McrC